MYMTKESIHNRLKEHYEAAKAASDREIFGIFLQGSQNYVDDRFFTGSDVDSRAVYIPELDDLILIEDTSSKTFIMENDEHIDRFDIRKFLNLIKKPGINNFEPIFTEYFIINPKYQEDYEAIVELREKLVRVEEKKFLMSTMGVSHRDHQTMFVRKGGEDSDIAKYGYSRKRLSNIIRFNLTVKNYVMGEPFTKCLKSLDQDTLYEIRRTDLMTLEEATELAEKLDSETKRIAESYVQTHVDTTTIDQVNQVIINVIRKSMK